jgi:hypothetical protein
VATLDLHDTLHVGRQAKLTGAEDIRRVSDTVGMMAFSTFVVEGLFDGGQRPLSWLASSFRHAAVVELCEACSLMEGFEALLRNSGPRTPAGEFPVT